jgi:prepilin-type N-terminal cleavage/methylation domain-containing protein
MLAAKRGIVKDSGFTLIEAMVAIVIIGAVVAAQASLLVIGAKAQTRLSAQRLASSILQSEIESLQTTPWDDLMLTPVATPGSPPLQLCPLGGNSLRSSAQIVRPQTIVREDDITFIVTRDIRWTNTNEPVTCDAIPNDRADTKTLVVTIAWTSEGLDKTRTGSLILSRYRTTPSEVIVQ